jgi:hypothetical protein
MAIQIYYFVEAQIECCQLSQKRPAKATGMTGEFYLK